MKINTLVRKAAAESERLMAATARFNELTNQIEKALAAEKAKPAKAKKPFPPTWAEKANPVKVIAWISRREDGAAVWEIRDRFHLNERQWLKLREALEAEGCTLTGATNKRRVHVPRGKP